MIARSRVVGACIRARFSSSSPPSSTSSGGSNPADKVLRLSFACPHVTYCRGEAVKQVDLSSEDGDIGILAGHAPTLIQLRPGVLRIIRDAASSSSSAKSPEKYFVAGGFATINPASELFVAAMEAVPIEQLDASAIESGLQEATALVTRSADSADHKERAVSQIVLQTYQAMQHALKAP